MSNRRADAAACLAGYTTADPAEQAFHRRMLALLESAGDPFARAHFAPGHFTASAFVLSPDERQLLLIRHRKLKMWLQPGGHFDAEDTSVDAATRREVAEETGISALDPLADGGLFDVDVHDIPALGAEPPHAHFDLRMAYVARTWALGDSDEVDGVRWVPLGEVRALQTDASVLRAVARLQRRWTSHP